MSRSGRGLRLVTEPARHPSAGGQRVLVVDHPIVAHRLSVLRAVETDNATFRTIMGELSAFVAYEALRTCERPSTGSTLPWQVMSPASE